MAKERYITITGKELPPDDLDYKERIIRLMQK